MSNKPEPKKFEVMVRYPAATRPFVDPHADPQETLASLKARVLKAFQLEEIQDPNQTIQYFLYDEKDTKLENLSLTLADIADGKHVIKLKLVQQIIQGDEGGVTLDEMCFAADLEAVLATEEAARWKIQHSKKLCIEVLLHSAKCPEELYLARLEWDFYPKNPPSLKFLDPSNGSTSNPRAWPQCSGFRPESLDSCVSWTREGHGLHPEWVNAPATRWDPTGNALFRALNCLQDTLDLDYRGRFQG
jgi:hypothetical protein